MSEERIAPRAAQPWPKRDVAVYPSAIAAHRLQASGHPTLRRIACRYEDGILTLEGRLNSFYLKQVAQSLVKSIDQVRRVDNRIEVTGRFSNPRFIRH